MLKSKPLERVRELPAAKDVVRDDTERLNLLIPAAVKRRWKTEAAERGVTITALLLEAMERHLSTMKK